MKQSLRLSTKNEGHLFNSFVRCYLLELIIETLSINLYSIFDFFTNYKKTALQIFFFKKQKTC